MMTIIFLLVIHILEETFITDRIIHRGDTFKTG